jgi:hypothetical protein
LQTIFWACPDGTDGTGVLGKERSRERVKITKTHIFIEKSRTKI